MHIFITVKLGLIPRIQKKEQTRTFVREVIAHRVSLVTVGVETPSQTESQESLSSHKKKRKVRSKFYNFHTELSQAQVATMISLIVLH